MILRKILKKHDYSIDEEKIENLQKSLGFKLSVKRLRKAKRITLRVCPFNGELRITIPQHSNIDAMVDFIGTNMVWIKSQMRKKIPLVRITNGTSVPIFGYERKILAKKNCLTNFYFTRTSLIIPETTLPFNDQISSVIYQIATQYFTEISLEYAEKLNVTFDKISIKDTKSRWGSCSSDKKLMFSWRLIMAPKKVSSYVAAHEIAHLKHMNHSKNYWKVVNFLSPDYKVHRNWLHIHGKHLHRYFF